MNAGYIHLKLIKKKALMKGLLLLFYEKLISG
jgi:hypothetical protein